MKFFRGGSRAKATEQAPKRSPHLAVAMPGREAFAPSVEDGLVERLRSDPSNVSELVSLFASACMDWRQKLERDESASAWRMMGGEELEPFLRYDPELGGIPVRLVDSKFLHMTANHGMRMIRRQDLPEEAFIDLETLRKAPKNVRIVCLSHPWLQPDHPDPKGVNLRRLVGMLLDYTRTHDSFVGEYCTGVMIDYCSCMQRGANNEERTPTEAALFKAGLTSLTVWYSHQMTSTFKLTLMPDRYPVGYSFPAGISPNTAAYADRGWCFFEASVSAWVRDSMGVFDLGAMSIVPTMESDLEGVARGRLLKDCIAGRPPPIGPSDFRRILETKSFTSKKADVELVGGLYAKAFEERMARVRNLHYSECEWGDDDIMQLCTMLESCRLLRLASLELNGNMRVTDVGVRALADTVRAGAAPALSKITLSRGWTTFGEDAVRDEDRISDAALQVLREAQPLLKVEVDVHVMAPPEGVSRQEQASPEEHSRMLEVLELAQRLTADKVPPEEGERLMAELAAQHQRQREDERELKLAQLMTALMQGLELEA